MTIDDDRDREQIRSVLAAARTTAPTPDGWDDVSARAGARRTSSTRRLLAAAAVVVAITGVVGLVLLRSDGDRDEVPADEDLTTETVAVVDPLADLGEDDWAVPLGELPPGQRVLVAIQGAEQGRTVVIGGESADEVYVSVRPGSGEPSEDGETTDIGGVAWGLQLLRDDAGEPVGTYLHRAVGDRSVTLTTSGSLDLAADIAAALRAVSTAELPVDVLDADGEYTEVARLGALQLQVRGVNGFYCYRLADTDAMTTSGGCTSFVEPDSPIAALGGFGGPDGSYLAGLTSGDVARITFVRPDGVEIVLEPVDVSGTFDERFWITDDPALSASSVIDTATVTLTDGTDLAVEQQLGGRWLVTGEVTERPSSDTTVPATSPAVPATTSPSVPPASPPSVPEALGAYTGGWLLPIGDLPTGYEVSVATESGGGVSRGVIIDGDDLPEVTIQMTMGLGASDPASAGAEAPVWEVSPLTNQASEVIGHLLRHQAGSTMVSVSGTVPLETLGYIAGLLQPVDEAELPVPILDPTDATTRVVTTDDAALDVNEANGYYCGHVTSGSVTGVSGCNATTEPGAPVTSLGVLMAETPLFAAGLAEPTVARIEFELSDGESVVVEPVDESGRFGHRFWITADARIAMPGLADRALVTYDDGSTASATRLIGTSWLVDS